MSIFPSGSEWSGEKITEAFDVSLYPLSHVALVLNFLGVIAFYSFKRHRAFPASVLAWVGVLNVVYSAYLIAKWAPDSASHKAIAIEPTKPMCYLSLWFDIWDFFSLTALNTLIALTLYLSVCKRIELEREANPWYFWGYVAFYWIIVIVAPLAITYTPNGIFYSQGACFSVGNAILGGIITQLVMITFQLFCVISAIVHAKSIISASSAVRTKRDLRMLYMVIRFSLTILDEILYLLPYYLNTLQPGKIPPVQQTEFGLLAFGLASVCDGCILLFGNRALVRWALKRARLISGATDSDSTSGGKSVSMQARGTSSAATPTTSQGVNSAGGHVSGVMDV